jgi:3'(2'), 5'-bisphosphate nucleotidase
MNIDFSKVLTVVEPLAVNAGKAIMKIYNTDITVEEKEDKSPLTLADTVSNEIIVSCLRSKFSEYAILAEESKDDLSRLENDYCFIVDPLDGTKEFIGRNGQFTVNIALSYKYESVLGVIYVPAREHLYYAYKGGGAFFEDLKSGIEKKIYVSSNLDNLTVVGSRSHSSQQEAEMLERNKHKIGKVISVGSSLKGCMIAAGEADIYYRFGLTSEWDIAAMQCIVEEAGGVFRQMDGSPMRYNREDILNRLGFYAVNRPENVL